MTVALKVFLFVTTQLFVGLAVARLSQGQRQCTSAAECRTNECCKTLTLPRGKRSLSTAYGVCHSFGTANSGNCFHNFFRKLLPQYYIFICIPNSISILYLLHCDVLELKCQKVLFTMFQIKMFQTIKNGENQDERLGAPEWNVPCTTAVYGNKS